MVQQFHWRRLHAKEEKPHIYLQSNAATQPLQRRECC